MLISTHKEWISPGPLGPRRCNIRNLTSIRKVDAVFERLAPLLTISPPEGGEGGKPRRGKVKVKNTPYRRKTSRTQMNLNGLKYATSLEGVEIKFLLKRSMTNKLQICFV